MFDNYDDDDLWDAAISDVKPLKNKSRSKNENLAPANKLKPPSQLRNNVSQNVENSKESSLASAHLGSHKLAEKVKQNQSLSKLRPTLWAESGPKPTQLSDSKDKTGWSDTANLICAFGNGVDKNLRKKLASGQIAPTQRLDLHGYFEGDAWLAVMDFLREAPDFGHRCVIIVHGKGKGYGENKDMGVIKSQMFQWLIYHPKVLAFHTAIPKDGGRGAMYVYLKRNKQV